MKSALKQFVKTVIFYLRYFAAVLFVNELRKQHFNTKRIPIFIISFNQLEYLKKLLNFLWTNEYLNIIIIDNNSTYKPLLSYFEEIKDKVKIVTSEKNYGHLAFWELEDQLKEYTNGYYVVTDPDIVPIHECPGDFLKKFKSILLRNPLKTKVGFSLSINNIPDTNPNKNKILNWESKFWSVKTKENNYIAPIDTTFALYRPFYKYSSYNFYRAIRTNYPYTAIHGGWYVNPNNMTEEQVYYVKTTNSSSSWLHSKEGKNIYN